MDFKIYLTRQDVENGKPEIRRFTADYAEADEIVYPYFLEKLHTIFPDLRGKRFEVSWKDSDHDNVLISSTKEFQVALLEMVVSTIKRFDVIVYPESDNLGYLHRDITCDGCEKDVYGFRYKCIQCPNYDQCSDCESKLLHSEHYMLRIANSAQTEDAEKMLQSLQCNASKMPRGRKNKKLKK